MAKNKLVPVEKTEPEGTQGFDPMNFDGKLSDQDTENRRAVRKFRKTRGLVSGKQVVDIRTGEKLIFLKPIQDRNMRCTTITGFNKAIKQVQIEATENPMAVRPTTHYVNKSDVIVADERNLISVDIYTAKVNTPENKKLLDTLKQAETKRDGFLKQASTIDTEIQGINKQLFSTFTV